MPRPKRAKTKAPKGPDGQPSNGALTENAQAEVAVAEASSSEELQPPTSPVETADLPPAQERPIPAQKRRDRPPPQKPAPNQTEQRGGAAAEKGADDKDHIPAASLNLPKLQAMSIA